MADDTTKKTAAKKAAKKAAEVPATRRKREAWEKAEEALGIEERRVTALDERITRFQQDSDERMAKHQTALAALQKEREQTLASLTAEREEAVERRDFLRQDPALKKRAATEPDKTEGDGS